MINFNEMLVIKNTTVRAGNPRPVRLHLPHCPELRIGQTTTAYKHDLRMEDIERFIARGDIEVTPATSNKSGLRTYKEAATPTPEPLRKKPLAYPGLPKTVEPDYDPQTPPDPATLEALRKESSTATELDLTRGVAAPQPDYDEVRKAFLEKLEAGETTEAPTATGEATGEVTGEVTAEVTGEVDTALSAEEAISDPVSLNDQFPNGETTTIEETTSEANVAPAETEAPKAKKQRKKKKVEPNE